MGTDWDTGDDDLEQLLEFDDSDQIIASDIGRKQQSPSNAPTSASTAEPTGSTPTDSDAVNPRNSPEQLQPEEQQATEDGDKSSEGNEWTSHPGTSLWNVRGEHAISQHSLGPDEQEFNEETNNFHDKRSDDGGADCSDEEDLNDQDGEQDVRLASDGRRDRRASAGGDYGRSEETRGRASKRIRQDGNAGTGWDDPIVVDDFAKGGIDCSQGGLPGDRRSLQASPLLSSPERPLVQEAAEDGEGCHISGVGLAHRKRDCPLERETSPPVTVLGYKIPGPAGAVQSCLNSTVHRAKGLTHVEKYCGPGRLSHRPVVAADDLDFREGPWLAALDVLNDGDSTFGNHSSRSTIVTVKATKRHIPQLVVIINTAVRNGLGDLSVTLKDPTGTIGGTIHRKVLTELEDGHLISAGAVIIIRKVAVFSPTPFKHYLNITMRNVDRIFGKDTIAPKRRGKAINDKDDLGIPGRDHPFPKPGLNDASQTQTAAKEGYQSETNAPNFCHSDREGATDLTHTLDNDERIQADETLISGTRVRNSRPLQDSIDSRKRALTANVGDPNDPPSEFFIDARASQDAKAKAAGWDFSEDVEDLLADDLF